MKNSHQWITAGQGTPPRVLWSVSSDAPLVSCSLQRESEQLIIADTSGGLYSITKGGRIDSVVRGPTPIRALAMSDVGQGGACLVGDNLAYFFTPRLEFRNAIELPDSPLALAVEAHGRFAAVSLANGSTVILDGPRKPIVQFETVRPLIELEFLVGKPALVGIADYGLICCHDFRGEQIWQEKLWANAGDFCTSGDGKIILLASFSHGLQRYDRSGNNVGSYQLEGTVNRVSCSFDGLAMTASTVEGYLYWISSEGDLIWGGQAPEPIAKIICDPLGTGIYCGFESGKILRLTWAGI